MAGARSSGRTATAALALAAVVALGLLPVSDGAAQTKRVRPAEEAPEQYPEHPHRDDAFYFCTACHSFKVVAAQSMSRDRWDESLTWMVKRHSMPDVQGEDRRKILDYLEKAFPERRDPRGWQNPFTPK
jgi:hypothetical protein